MEFVVKQPHLPKILTCVKRNEFVGQLGWSVCQLVGDASS
jgi:hypothetical protein